MALPVQPLDAPASTRRAAARSRRKEDARRAAGDVALALFAEQGFEATTVDDIVQQAGISTATFFRYFPTKAEAVFNDPEAWLPSLWRAVLEGPPEETDLQVVLRGLESEWVPILDRQRARLQRRAIGSSPVLRGISAEVGLRWRAVVSDALARRHRLPVGDADTELTAAIALQVVGTATEAWLSGPDDGDLSVELDIAFGRLDRLARSWIHGTATPALRKRPARV